jgi:hypothetical protein
MRLLPERGTRNVNKNILKSIVAVFAGAVASTILSVGTVALMHATGIFPAGTEPMNDVLFALATMYRTIYGLVGAHITARLALDRPMMYALVLGAFGVVASTAGAMAMWSKLPALGPKFTLAHRAGTAAALVGGQLRLMQLDERTEVSLAGVLNQIQGPLNCCHPILLGIGFCHLKSPNGWQRLESCSLPHLKPNRSIDPWLDSFVLP